MGYFKLQLGCFIVVLYIVFLYVRERKIYDIKRKDTLFACLLFTGLVELLFDGGTAYTVNHLGQVPEIVNRLLHMCFFVSLDILVFLVFLYMYYTVFGRPANRRTWTFILLPIVVNIVLVICFMPQLSYRIGKSTNYSMGISVVTCYVMVAIYIVMTVYIFVRGWKRMDLHKRINISTCLVAMICVSLAQMIFPEILITSLVPAIVVLGSYLNLENPVFLRLKHYHEEMVMGFATLVENRDDNTGGHIHRTTAYVEILARELKRRGYYRDELTRDYIKNLIMAAPMHDVGKIAIPDSILQKPGKLTPEEFEIMKTHSARGGVIIQETFGHLGEEQYNRIAYEVARHHHEKWNGKGYPDGLAGDEIPLCARIMTIADVFDAVSAKRCYRDAMPLPKCFQIVEEGIGKDFDPVIAEVFLSIRDTIVEVYKKTYTEAE